MVNRRPLADYIEKCWDDLLIHCEDSETHLALPYDFVAPSVHRVDGFAFSEQFYWDTYFTATGLIASGRLDIAVGMVNNLLHLLDELGYVPNSNNRLHLGRSQPPLLSSMVLMIYEQTQDIAWLKKAYRAVVHEYQNVWMSSVHPHHRNVFKGLSRYYHSDQAHRGAEDESGWDYTDRFDDRALDFVPIDLNCFLFKYEADLSCIAQMLGDKHSAARWQDQALTRQKVVTKYLWNDKDGMFYDYDYVNKKPGSVKSLAAYVALFSGLATKKQAKRLVNNLRLFQTPHGLSTTPYDSEPIMGKQWTAPNGWAPLHFLVVEGLERYGYQHEAATIRKAWLHTVKTMYEKKGLVYEKYNVVDPHSPPTSAVYPDQFGFAWSNAITAYFSLKK